MNSKLWGSRGAALSWQVSFVSVLSALLKVNESSYLAVSTVGSDALRVNVLGFYQYFEYGNCISVLKTAA